MKVSILDQSPVSSGMSERDALLTSIRLAQHAEKLGYERFWIAEHHDLFGLACSNPSVMLSAIGAQTNTIKIGAGAVRSEEHTSELQSRGHLVCRLLLEKKNNDDRTVVSKKSQKL